MKDIVKPCTKKQQTRFGNVLSLHILDGIAMQKTSKSNHPNNIYGETPV